MGGGGCMGGNGVCVGKAGEGENEGEGDGRKEMACFWGKGAVVAWE